jgi:hypothetical protein
MAFKAKAIEILTPLLPNWSFSTLNAIGMFGGLLLIWNSSFVALNPIFCAIGIVLKGEAKDLGKVLKIHNLYGTYVDLNMYW